MSATQEDKQLQRVHTLVTKWNGADAMVWKHQRSHQGLVLRLASDEQDGCLLLYLGDVSWYAGPLRWQNAVLDAAKIEPPEGDAKYLLEDKAAGLVARCAVLEARHMTEK